jgi:hypothetical protein
VSYYFVRTGGFSAPINSTQANDFIPPFFPVQNYLTVRIFPINQSEGRTYLFLTSLSLEDITSNES